MSPTSSVAETRSSRRWAALAVIAAALLFTVAPALSAAVFVFACAALVAAAATLLARPSRWWRVHRAHPPSNALSEAVPTDRRVATPAI
jgi:uncharacterized protein (DUF58 family)